MEGSEKEIRLRQAIGQADLCELLSVAFSFPNENLAQALANGTFVSDGIACMVDVGADETSLEGGRQAMSHFGGRDVYELFGSMRKAYSLLYLAPGSDVKVFPYEAAFRFVAEGREGTPTLFRSPITLDVERFMAEAGVATIKGRTEPCDSIFEEYSHDFCKHAHRNYSGFNLATRLVKEIMFIGVFSRDSKVGSWLRSIRAELSIVAWMLSLRHIVYLISYAPRVLAGGSLGGNVALSFLVVLVLLGLLRYAPRVLMGTMWTPSRRVVAKPPIPSNTAKKAGPLPPAAFILLFNFKRLAAA